MKNPKTICAKCEHHLSSSYIWYENFCKASPISDTIDPVTGKTEYELGVNKYRFCRDVNKGDCKLFKKIEGNEGAEQ